MEDQFDNDVRFITLLDAGFHLAKDQRQSFLQEACSTDPSLLAELTDQLKWEDRMGDFLLEPLIRRPDVEHPFQPGSLAAGRFRVVREAGRGAMGVIYEAIDERLNQCRALKCARPGFHARLPPEARAAMRVTHDNICRVYEIHTSETDQGPIDILSMEYVEGETLASRLARDGALSTLEALNVLKQLCLGLTAAHKQNVLHRDLKTTNVMLSKDQRAVIMDFGLARDTAPKSDLHFSSELRGAPPYIAPELWKGATASVASDVYALGSIGYEMVTGGHPFPPDATMEQRLSEAPPPPSARNPALDPMWDRVLIRCLQPDPSKRFDSAQSLLEDLATPAHRQIRIWVAGVLAASLVAAALLAGYALRTRTPPVSPMARLAVLPLIASGCESPAMDGVLYDVSDRLQKLKGLVSIPISQSVGNRVITPGDARSKLGATHALETHVRCTPGTFDIHASVIENKSAVAVSSLASTYTVATLGRVSTALVGTVTGALKLNPGDSPRMSELAYPYYAQAVYLNRNDKRGSDEAVSLFQQASGLDPKSVLPLTGLTEAYLSKYRATEDRQWLVKARQALREAESRNPDSAAVHFEAAGVDRAAGSNDRAAERYRRALQLEPWNGDTWNHLAITYGEMEGRQAEAAQAFMKAIELQPGYFEPHADFAVFYFRRGEYARSAAEFRSALELAPAHEPSHSSLCGVYTVMGRYGDAEAACRRALELAPTASSYNNLGAIFAYQGRDAESLANYRKAIELNPSKYWYFQNTGDSLRRLNLPVQAQNDYRRGKHLAAGKLREAPSDAYARSLLGYFAIRLGDSSAGRNEIEQALHFAPDNTPVLRNAALAYEALHRRNRVLELLRDAPAGLLQELDRHPDMTAVHRDPQFIQLLKNVK